MGLKKGSGKMPTRGPAVWSVISIFEESSFYAGRQAHTQKNWAPKKRLNRWQDCVPVGQQMPGTRFIAFRVPLTKESKS